METLKVIIPLIQSLVWPIFIAILLFIFKDQVKALIEILVARIESGDKIKLCSLEMERPDKLILNEEPIPIDEKSQDYPLHYKNSVYLWHTVSSTKLDIHDLTERKQVQVIVDADSDEIISNIEKVIYHLHPSFKNNIKEITDREKDFMIQFRAWGSFNLKAEIYFKGFNDPLILYRYINLQTF